MPAGSSGNAIEHRAGPGDRPRRTALFPRKDSSSKDRA